MTTIRNFWRVLPASLQAAIRALIALTLGAISEAVLAWVDALSSVP